MAAWLIGGLVVLGLVVLMVLVARFIAVGMGTLGRDSGERPPTPGDRSGT